MSSNSCACSEVLKIHCCREISYLLIENEFITVENFNILDNSFGYKPLLFIVYDLYRNINLKHSLIIQSIVTFPVIPKYALHLILRFKCFFISSFNESHSKMAQYIFGIFYRLVKFCEYSIIFITCHLNEERWILSYGWAQYNYLFYINVPLIMLESQNKRTRKLEGIMVKR